MASVVSYYFLYIVITLCITLTLLQCTTLYHRDDTKAALSSNHNILKCSDGEQCSLYCQYYMACRWNDLYCATNQPCYVLCDNHGQYNGGGYQDGFSCSDLTIYAQNASILTIDVYQMQHEFANTNIYAPDNGPNNGYSTIITCGITQYNSNPDEQYVCGYRNIIYAKEGWNDVLMVYYDLPESVYTGYYNYRSEMHCGETSNDWTCAGFILSGNKTVCQETINKCNTYYLPTQPPTNLPSLSPTTDMPTNYPTNIPTLSPTESTETPTNHPSVSPSKDPTFSPTNYPTNTPSASPTYPTNSPTNHPSSSPSNFPTTNPTQPTYGPTASPTAVPTISPSISPSRSPTNSPTDNPTLTPTLSPTLIPSQSPTSIFESGISVINEPLIMICSSIAAALFIISFFYLLICLRKDMMDHPGETGTVSATWKSMGKIDKISAFAEICDVAKDFLYSSDLILINVEPFVTFGWFSLIFSIVGALLFVIKLLLMQKIISSFHQQRKRKKEKKKIGNMKEVKKINEEMNKKRKHLACYDLLGCAVEDIPQFFIGLNIALHYPLNTVLLLFLSITIFMIMFKSFKWFIVELIGDSENEDNEYDHHHQSIAHSQTNSVYPL